MNVYVEICRDKLRAIKDGGIKFADHFQMIMNSINDRLSYAEEVVVCGLSPVGKKCRDFIGEYLDVPVRVFDCRDKENNKIGIGGGILSRDLKRTYIICSREEALHYMDAVPRVGSRVVSYNELLLLDKRFGIEGSLLHNKKFVTDAMENVFLHASEYDRMIDCFADTFSKELLGRWLLYRLYADIGIMRNIKGKGKPYFDPEIISLGDSEVFVDAGGYDGDTLMDFIEYSGGSFSSYFFLEPQEAVLSKAKNVYGTDERIIFLQKGLSNHSGIDFFSDECADVPEMMKNESGNLEVEVTTIDELGAVPTFIKMDIEGAECDALDGGENTIRTYKPKLSVCVYHRSNDILDVFHRMQSYGYSRFYLRAERDTLDFDVVLYGIPD